jgi:hypothetical protein
MTLSHQFRDGNEVNGVFSRQDGIIPSGSRAWMIKLL